MVFLSDESGLEKKVKEFAEKEKLKNTALTIDQPSGPEDYKIAKEAKEALEKHYPDFLLRQVIRQCTKFAQASSEGIPIFAYDSESKGAQDIQAVLDEVQARIGAPVRLKAVESA